MNANEIGINGMNANEIARSPKLPERLVLLAKLTHITSGLSACATNVRLHASPTALDTLLPLDGSLCNFISFIGLAHDRVWLLLGLAGALFTFIYAMRFAY